MATIFDIAKKAGVSITTVSRALNGHSDVNAKTRQRVVEIAEELHYYPNAAARNLQGKKNNTIAFAPRLHIEFESDLFLKEFMGVLALDCLRHDFSLLVAVARQDQPQNEIYKELAGSGRVDGIIIADVEPHDERISLLQELQIPFVAFGRTLDYSQQNYPFVDVDGTIGIEAIVQHLYEQGHRRIAFLGDQPRSSCMIYRYEGYQTALQKLGLENDKRLVAYDLEEQSQVDRAVFQLLKEHPTAMVVVHDRLAVKTIAALEKLGAGVGPKKGQIAVTGFDDLPFAAYLKPALTTVRQPIGLTCSTLLDVLVSILKNQPEILKTNSGAVWLGPQQILLQPELVVRESA